MFGFGKKTAKGVGFVQKKQWEKAQEHLEKATAEEKVEMATACANMAVREVYDVLAPMVRDSDPKVQLAAVKAFGKIGDPRAVVHLQWLLARVPENQTELVSAIHDAITASRAGKTHVKRNNMRKGLLFSSLFFFVPAWKMVDNGKSSMYN